jgi:DNA-directed RNA polymerase specialized sigma24 family protein
VPIEEIEIAAPEGTDDYLLEIHDALTALEELDERKAQLVKLRYFVWGLLLKKIAEILNLSVPTLKRDWAFSRAWLQARIQGSGRINSKELAACDTIVLQTSHWGM